MEKKRERWKKNKRERVKKDREREKGFISLIHPLRGKKNGPGF